MSGRNVNNLETRSLNEAFTKGLTMTYVLTCYKKNGASFCNHILIMHVGVVQHRDDQLSTFCIMMREIPLVLPSSSSCSVPIPNLLALLLFPPPFPRARRKIGLATAPPPPALPQSPPENSHSAAHQPLPSLVSPQQSRVLGGVPKSCAAPANEGLHEHSCHGARGARREADGNIQLQLEHHGGTRDHLPLQECSGREAAAISFLALKKEMWPAHACEVSWGSMHNSLWMMRHAALHSA